MLASSHFPVQLEPFDIYIPARCNKLYCARFIRWNISLIASQAQLFAPLFHLIPLDCFAITPRNSPSLLRKLSSSVDIARVHSTFRLLFNPQERISLLDWLMDSFLIHSPTQAYSLLRPICLRLIPSRDLVPRSLDSIHLGK